MPDKKAENLSELSSEYLDCVQEIIAHADVKSMKNYNQHGDVDCLRHSLNVSTASYIICKKLGLDYRSAARGGLLHDFFLYDWHMGNPHGGLHAFTHPKVAALNADSKFKLNKKEQDVIKKHMWPLTVALPKYPETLIVVLVDKFYCVREVFRNCGNKIMRELHGLAY